MLGKRALGKGKRAKASTDEKAAKQRKSNLKREEDRKKKGVDMDATRLAQDEAKIEVQRPGVMKNFKLWLPTDGRAMQGNLHYDSSELRTALTAKRASDYTRPLPQLVHAVKVAYGYNTDLLSSGD